MVFDKQSMELVQEVLRAAAGDTAPELNDLEQLVTRSLIMLSFGDPSQFSHYGVPSSEVTIWLQHAEIKQVRGLLMATLRRWHELQLADDEPQARASRRVPPD